MKTLKKQKMQCPTLSEMLEQFKMKPRINYLWSGIKEKSFGLVFGPSKAGKTIFCENLAMHIASGSPSFFGHKLCGKPRKVLFAGLEEFWESRVERNQKQYMVLSDPEKQLLDINYMYQPVKFSRYITTSKDWENLIKAIKSSGAEVVFIDSITRMNHGNLEESKTAEEIMQRLRDICYELQITLICIHHTPKMQDSAITMDKIKGSAVFAQESDFAIGVNQTSQKVRYVKTVYFRYADDSKEKVKEFEINESIWLQHIGDDYESSILQRSDRRRDDEKRDLIIKVVKGFHCKKVSTRELVKTLRDILGIKDRQIKNLLKELVAEEKISSPSRGYYSSIDCTGKEASDEEE